MASKIVVADRADRADLDRARPLPKATASHSRVRTVLCDQDPLALRVLREVLAAAGITVIAEADNARDAVDLAIHYRPDLLVIDVSRDADGVVATRAIRDRAAEVKVLMLSRSGEVELGMRGLRAGASGYVCKDVDPADLARYVRRVAAGELAVSPNVVRALISFLRAFPENGVGLRPVHSTLTSREWEVLDALCAGDNLDRIAERFVLSPETVRSHMKNIMRKLQVHSHLEAVKVAQRIRLPFSAGGGAE